MEKKVITAFGKLRSCGFLFPCGAKAIRPLQHLLFVFLLILLPGHCIAASLYESVRKGANFYAQEHYDEALNAFIDAQIENPENPQLKFNIASSKYMMKNYEEALSGFLDVAATARDARLEEKALFNAGNSLYRQGKLEQAVEYYQKALELDPDDTEALQNLEFVREEIKRRMNEAKNTQDKQQQQEQKQCENPQPQDNQTAQNSESPQKEGQQAGEQQEQNADNRQQPQPAAADGEQQSAEAGQQEARADSEMTRQQAEQLLNSVQENRDNLKKAEQPAKSRGSSRSAKDW